MYGLKKINKYSYFYSYSYIREEQEVAITAVSAKMEGGGEWSKALVGQWSIKMWHRGNLHITFLIFNAKQ